MVSAINPAGAFIGTNIGARIGASNIGPGSNVAARGEPARPSPAQTTNAGIENSISANDTIRPIDGISLSPQILVALAQSQTAQTAQTAQAPEGGALQTQELAQNQSTATQDSQGSAANTTSQNAATENNNGNNNADPAPNNPTNGQELSPEEQDQVRELQQRDQEVRAHEQAHATIGGPFAGAPTFETVRGPDGRQYAVAGEVQIDASPENDPEATIRKLEVVIRAALAPAEPSPQDRQVAQQARQNIIQARADLQEQQQEEQEQGNNTQSSSQSAAANNTTANSTAAATQNPLAQRAANGLERADQTQSIGQTSPIQTNDNQDDQVDISQDAEQIIAALFG